MCIPVRQRDHVFLGIALVPIDANVRALEEDMRRRRLKKKRQNLSQRDVQDIAEMMGMTATVADPAAGSTTPAPEE